MGELEHESAAVSDGSASSAAVAAPRQVVAHAEPPIPAGMPRPGEIVGDGYRVVELIAVGGQGAVYRVHEEGLEREAALKVLLPALRSDPLRCYQFSREARALSRCADPGLVQIYRVGKDPTFGPFIVMELLRGATLRDVLEHAPRRRLRIRDALRVMLELAETLDVLHRQGIIHRDLKPENIYLSKVRRRAKDGAGHKDDLVVKILDLGAAMDARDRRSPTQVEGKGRIVTPAYMSPEQIRGKAISQASDQYSLAVVIYECIAGEQLFVHHHVGRADYQHWVMWHLGGEPEPFHAIDADVPEYLWPLFERALAKTPEERYPSFGELSAAIRAVLRRVLEDETHVEHDEELNEYLTTVLEADRSGDRRIRQGTDVMTYPDDHSRRAGAKAKAAEAPGRGESNAPDEAPPNDDSPGEAAPDEDSSSEAPARREPGHTASATAPSTAIDTAPAVASVTAPSAAMSEATTPETARSEAPTPRELVASSADDEVATGSPDDAEAVAALARRLRLRVFMSPDELLRPGMTIAPFAGDARALIIRDEAARGDGPEQGQVELALDDLDATEGAQVRLTPDGEIVVTKRSARALVGTRAGTVDGTDRAMAPGDLLFVGLTGFAVELADEAPDVDLARFAVVRASAREAVRRRLPARVTVEVVATAGHTLRGKPLTEGQRLTRLMTKDARRVGLQIDPPHGLLAELQLSARGGARLITNDPKAMLRVRGREELCASVDVDEIFEIAGLSLRLLPIAPLRDDADDAPAPAVAHDDGAAGRDRSPERPRLALAVIVGVVAATLLAIALNVVRGSAASVEGSPPPDDHEAPATGTNDGDTAPLEVP